MMMWIRPLLGAGDPGLVRQLLEAELRVRVHIMLRICDYVDVDEGRDVVIRRGPFWVVNHEG